MYKFILGQWRMGAVTAEWVQSCVTHVPQWITQVQCDVILATPQDLVGTQSIVSPMV